MNSKISRALYGGFILLGTYYLVVQRDPGTAIAQMGIALAFDPFDQDQKWNDRPTWQKAVLFVHLGVAAALLGYAIGWNDK